MKSHYIYGRFTKGKSKDAVAVDNPATSKILDRVANGSAEDVKAGAIWINDPLSDNYAGPFGGMKYTGGGRELGEEGLDEFRETKHVHWDI